jgi:hypothetical protein
MEGRCTCGAVRYRMTERPLFVHACHCTWCQREQGSGFAIHAVIERRFIDVPAGEPDEVELLTPSGLGQVVVSCPVCQVALWCHYDGRRDLAYVKVGTLERPADVPPQVHIHTTTKQEWLVLDPRSPALPGYYDWRVQWPAESVARRVAMLAER